MSFLCLKKKDKLSLDFKSQVQYKTLRLTTERPEIDNITS